MLYGNNALVHTYTKLAKVDAISVYKAALGAENVRVKFELQP